MGQRFSVEDELRRIDRGLVQDAQKYWGTTVEWYRFDPESSRSHDVYDVGEERRWKPPLRIPCLWVIREEGRDTYREEGRYTIDSLQLAVAKTVLRDKLHWTDLDLTVEGFIKDRIRFEGKVFTIASFQLEGQLLDRDTIIGVSANEVRQDQYAFDPDFVPEWSPSTWGSGEVVATGALAGAGDGS